MPRAFISYSHRDETCKDHLVSHLNVLERQGLEAWDDRRISAGDDWYEKIKAAIAQCDVALLLISRHFLNSKFILDNEVPYLLKLREKAGIRVIPVILSPCQWSKIDWLSPIQARPVDGKPLSGMSDHEADAALSLLAGEIHELVPTGNPQQSVAPFNLNTPIIIDKLPTVPGEFFGREAELELLDKALTDNKIRIVEFIAAGGTGKTKLLRHWLDNNQERVPNRIVWSFYSQGTTEAKQVSSSPLFDEGFKAFGVNPSQFKTEEDKADAFAELLIQHHCLLVLDGLEPLQHGGRGQDGRLKDHRALGRLLIRLINQPGALCVITTRIHVHELRDRPQVKSHDLGNLSTADGIHLLRSHQVQAREEQLRAVVEKVGGHALTLHLLGNAIKTHLYGDALRLDTLDSLVDKYDETGRHAFKVMQAYEEWLRDDQGQPLPELQLLYLLGLFDHPIETGALQVLWDEQIPGLTQGIDRRAWNVAIRDLRDTHHLLSQHPHRQDLLDCHPLIREYFGGRLQANHTKAWQQAHARLYAYYKALPEMEQPDSLDEMRPLFAAVAHGCAAGMHQQALYEVYWPRIQRMDEYYLLKKLGAFSDDLAVVTHFFAKPWHIPELSLTPDAQAVMLAISGFDLRALGRLREALEPMRVDIKMHVSQKKWTEAARGAGNLSELQLTLGDVAAAVHSGAECVRHANSSQDIFTRMYTRTTHADALHQSGRAAKALILFQEAVHLQAELQPNRPRLYSLPSYLYCDLLLSQARSDRQRIREVLELAHDAIRFEGSIHKAPKLDFALHRLTLARAHLQQAQRSSNSVKLAIGDEITQAAFWLKQSVDGFREAAQNQYLPLGLLTRALVHRLTGNHSLAQHDLQEVFDIAEPSGMRLHLTDYHLEAARLANDMGESQETIQHHLQAAADLIQQTGYHRRDGELAELQRTLLH